jgi:RNase H-fold protein (predicted Holliday junction resolvase)
MPYIIGFDPGRDKCGIAVVDAAAPHPVHYRQVISADQSLNELRTLLSRFEVHQILIGNQTGSKEWQAKIGGAFPELPLVVVNERHSSEEARKRYWDYYPAQGLNALLPKGMRTPPTPYDDLVALVLIERYLGTSISGPAPAL